MSGLLSGLARGIANRRRRRRDGLSPSYDAIAESTIFAEVPSSFNPPISSTVGEVGRAPLTANASILVPRRVRPTARPSAPFNMEATRMNRSRKLWSRRACNSRLLRLRIIPLSECAESKAGSILWILRVAEFRLMYPLVGVSAGSVCKVKKASKPQEFGLFR